MMNICSRESCSACWACKDICPKGCISIEYDDLAVPYPVIDHARCVECGLCSKVCPNNSHVPLHFPEKVYAAWSLDAETRSTSASGGIASELYRLFCADGGVAVGVALNEEYEAEYIMLDVHSDLTPVRNSKYTYSNTKGIYRDVKAYLDKGTRVLFIGLPCHVAGLLNFLRKPYTDLTTVDIICHGVAPSEYLKQHIRNLERIYQKRAYKCYFRDPRYKTHQFVFSVYGENDRCFYHKRVLSSDVYQLGYHKALTYRESCYHCRYARNERCSDLTIGDFSGLGRNENCDFNSIDVSCILTNTEKGERLLRQLSASVTLVQRPVAEALDYERQLNVPSEKHTNRGIFESRFKETYDFVASATEALGSEIRKSDLPPDFFRSAIKSFLRQILPEKVIRLLKDITGNAK